MQDFFVTINISVEMKQHLLIETYAIIATLGLDIEHTPTSANSLRCHNPSFKNFKHVFTLDNNLFINLLYLEDPWDVLHNLTRKPKGMAISMISL